MRRNRIIPFVLIIAITMLSFGPALAAPLAQEPAPAPCPTGTVSGTVVAVDPTTGTVTVDTGEGGLCTVNVNIDESHPIALLLGQYFGDINPETLTAALEEATKTVTGCAVDPEEDGTWTWVAPNEDGSCPEGSDAVKVTGYDPATGAYTAQPVGGGDPINLAIDDPAVAEAVQGALETLLVEWALESDGNLQTVSDQIAQYHEDGMGFGVLVKLYAIAQESAECQEPVEGETAECAPATVEELVTLFQSGVGMGQIFKEYGKPDKVGVGHVRQALDDKQTGQDKFKENKNKGNDPSGDVSAANTAVKKNGKPAKDNTLKGVCNAIAKNGKPKKNVTCP